MNEKIKELAEQAALNAVTKNFNGTSVEVQVPSENWAKEFAELIVRECMTICKEHPSRIVSNNWVADAVAPDVVRQFEEHFGVEE